MRMLLETWLVAGLLAPVRVLIDINLVARVLVAIIALVTFQFLITAINR